MLPMQQILAGQVAARRAPNVQRKAAVVEISPEKHMRLSQQQVADLADEYNEWRSQRFHINHTQIAVSYRRVENFLHYLASGGYYRQAGLYSGVAASTVHAYVHEVADFFLDIAPQHIALISGLEREVNLIL